MTDDDQVDRFVKILMADLMSVLHQHGIREIHIGAMMRLMGISDEVAAKHDNERVELSDDFAKYMKELNSPRPADQTLH